MKGETVYISVFTIVMIACVGVVGFWAIPAPFVQPIENTTAQNDSITRLPAYIGNSTVATIPPFEERQTTAIPGSTSNPTQTQQSTEKPAEKPAQQPTKKSTEKPTEKPTEKTAQNKAPSENNTAGPTHTATIPPTCAGTQKPTEKPTQPQKPVETEEPTVTPEPTPSIEYFVEETDDGRIRTHYGIFNPKTKLVDIVVETTVPESIDLTGIYGTNKLLSFIEYEIKDIHGDYYYMRQARKNVIPFPIKVDEVLFIGRTTVVIYAEHLKMYVTSNPEITSEPVGTPTYRTWELLPEYFPSNRQTNPPQPMFEDIPMVPIGILAEGDSRPAWDDTPTPAPTPTFIDWPIEPSETASEPTPPPFDDTPRPGTTAEIPDPGPGPTFPPGVFPELDNSSPEIQNAGN